jgi:hypothetical protein
MSKATEILLGPIVSRNGGFAFDTFTNAVGTTPGFTYRRVEQAKYDRNATMLGLRRASGFVTIACETVDEFRRRSGAMSGTGATQPGFVVRRDGVPLHA